MVRHELSVCIPIVVKDDALRPCTRWTFFFVGGGSGGGSSLVRGCPRNQFFSFGFGFGFGFGGEVLLALALVQVAERFFFFFYHFHPFSFGGSGSLESCRSCQSAMAIRLRAINGCFLPVLVYLVLSRLFSIQDILFFLFNVDGELRAPSCLTKSIIPDFSMRNAVVGTD